VFEESKKTDNNFVLLTFYSVRRKYYYSFHGRCLKRSRWHYCPLFRN